MGPLTLPYIVLPGAAAMATAWLVSDWRLAVAALAGGGAMLSLLPVLGGAAGVFLLPVFAGVALAGLVLAPLLVLRREADPWTRMTVALGVTVLAGLWLLTSTIGRA